MATVKMSTKGQVIIPAELRRKHAIREGDKFSVEVIDGKLVLTPLTTRSFMSMLGALRGEKSMTEELIRERAKETEEER